MKKIYLLSVLTASMLFCKAQFTVQITTNAAKCVGDTVNLIATVSGSGTAPYAYNWAVSSGTMVSNGNSTEMVLGINDVTVNVTVTDAVNQTASTQWLIDAKGISVDIPDTAILNCGSMVTVFAQVSGDTTGVNYVWSTGVSGSTNTSHNFSVTNLYRVLVTNSYSCQSGWDSVWVVYPDSIYNEVSFVPDDTVICVGVSTAFVNTSMKTKGWSYWWLYSDGLTSFGKNGIHTFAAPGMYPIQLRMDSSGCTFSSAYTTIQVLPFSSALCTNICSATFTVLPDSVSGVYVGYNYSAGANISYLWDFGDGNTSTLAYPTHTYAQPGMYSICLTVNNSLNGCTDTYCDSSFYVFKTEGGLMSQLIIQSPLTVDEYRYSYIKLFPNPAADFVTIEAKDATVLSWKLYNLNGQLLNAGKQPENRIPLTGINSGMYVAEVETVNGVARYRFFKQ